MHTVPRSYPGGAPLALLVYSWFFLSTHDDAANTHVEPITQVNTLSIT